MPEQATSTSPELSSLTGLTYRHPPRKLAKKLDRLVSEFGIGAVKATLGRIDVPWTNQAQQEYEEIADGPR